MPTFPLDDSWGVRSIGPEGESGYLDVRAGTPTGDGTGVFAWVDIGQPDDLGGTGGGYQFPDRIIREELVIGIDTSTFPVGHVPTAGTLTIYEGGFSLVPYPITIGIYESANIPSTFPDNIWTPGGVLATSPVLFEATFTEAPAGDTPVVFTLVDPEALDAALNKSGTTWFVGASPDLLSETYVPGGFGNQTWFGTRTPQAVLDLTTEEGGSPPATPSFRFGAFRP